MEDLINDTSLNVDDYGIAIQAGHFSRRTRLRSDIARAISANQFKVYYQPEVDLQTNEIFAAEAFVRWEHPEFGTLLPREFITIAEESDFMLEMGDWILNEICRHYSEWLNEGLPPIKIAVNYSSVQFFQKNFVDNIQKITAQHNLNPDFIVLEILERVSINDFSIVKSSIDKLHEVGVKVALDDFGTGFSSLEYLCKLNIDILKIDQLFINTIPYDRKNSIIIETIVNLAHKLGMKTIAEGVETLEQLNYLKAIGCQAGQGYFFSRPVPSSEYKKLLIDKFINLNDNQQPAEVFKEKRQYSRYRFPLYLEASMTILKYLGQDVHFGSTLVLIQDISAGGLCFFSTLCLPVRNSLLIQFSTTLLGKHVEFHGVPVWRKEVKENLYKYGVSFKISEKKRKQLIDFINQLELQFNNDPDALNGDFVRQSPYSYFQLM
ncbi:MAG TPA: EAL domain-containing protein [Clostridiales bacterium]|nr:EAL domain-containing protein [Clostridiales bacterium]